MALTVFSGYAFYEAAVFYTPAWDGVIYFLPLSCFCGGEQFNGGYQAEMCVFIISASRK